MPRRRTLLVLAAALATACAAPPLIEPATLEGWHAVETSGVRIVAEAPPESLRETASDLAEFDAAFAFLLGRRIAPSVPTTLYLVRDPHLARQMGLSGGVAGWAMETLEGAYGVVQETDKPIFTRRVLFHEYTHVILARHRKLPLPRWYNEGLATYFSTLGMRDGALVVGAVPSTRLSWLRQRGPMPLDRLFSNSTEGRYWAYDFYASAWLTAHYLIGSSQGRRELSRFEMELALGAELDAARETAFGRSLEELSEEIATHLGYLKQGVAAEMVLDPSDIEIAEPPAPKPIRAADVAYELGSLVLALADEAGDHDDLDVARELLETAAAAGAVDPRAHAALGHLLALVGEPETAQTEIEVALRRAPDDVPVLVRAGRVALASERHAEARERFEQALARDEGSAAAWLGLGRALARSGEPDAALDALQNARRIAWSDAIDLELGRLHVAAGRDEEALRVLQPIAQDPHGGKTAEQALELLREAGLGDENEDEDGEA